MVDGSAVTSGTTRSPRRSRSRGEVFLEQAFKMSHDGSFGEPVDNTAGVYVRCDDVRVIEFLAPVQDPEASDTVDRAGHTAMDSEGGSRGEELAD
jgi:hypothetical protein